MDFDLLLDGVEVHGPDGGPVAGFSRPPPRCSATSRRVDGVTAGQSRTVLPGVTVARSDVADGAVQVLVVVPADEALDPEQRKLEAAEGLSRKARAVLQGPEERLREGVVIADAGAAERSHDAEPLKGRQQRGALHRAAIVCVQSQLLRISTFPFDGLL